MKIETELKFRLTEKEYKNLLRKFEDAASKKVFEVSTMFDNEDGLMKKTDGRIRLRTKSFGRAEFCYKKPITRQGIKQEEEIEISVSCPENLVKILEKMGYKAVSSYERYRHTFAYHQCKITIDHFPFAYFLEIEGEEKAIVEVAKKLGFKMKDNLTDSCDSLFKKWTGSKSNFISFK